MPAIVNGQPLPDGWKAIAVRWLSRRYSGGTPDKNLSYYWNDGTIPWLNSGAVNQGVISQPSDFITEEGFANSSAKWMPRGSVVMALAGQGKTKAMVGYLDIETTGNQSLAAIVPSAIEGKFLYWWLTSQYRHIRNLSSQDGRDGLNLEMLGSIRCPVPPREAQQRIAAFLDEKTAQIDGLIAKKQALLKRLTEKRQAIITQAVTKGLNPAAPMKDSGIDWLGQIPAHWEALPLRRLADRVVTGRTPPSAAGDFFTDGEVPWYTPGDFDGLFLADADKALTVDAFGEGYAVRYPANSVLLVGIGATLGKVAVAREPCSSNQQINAIMASAETDPVFLAYSLHGFRAEVRMSASGNTLPILNQDKTKAIVVTRPPRPEQEQISAFLREMDQKIQAVGSKIAISVEFLRERRAAIVTNAVTGQIEVLQ